MSDKLYDRMPKEPPKAYHAFSLYRDMGLHRTLEQVRKQLGRPSVYLRVLEGWSAQWRWVERSRAWDHYLETKSREAAEAYIPIWEQRRQASLEANLLMAAMIRSRLQEMMTRPIIRETVKEVNGRNVTINEPAGWNWNTIINGAKVVAELEAESIAEGMLETEGEAFDASTASEEQLRDYVNKRVNRSKLR